MNPITGYLYDLSQPYTAVELTELFLLGSDVTCNHRVSGPDVEGRHARIEFKGSYYLIRDLRTKAGTYVNGTRVSEAYLNEGDEIKIGEAVITFSREKKTWDASIGLSSLNPTWQARLSSLGHVAKTDFPALLLGPSGSGKEILAEALHQNSPRARGPFITVNCSALTETLIESELFGHIKGSFTGAINDRKGAFEAARGGTLFLDEIGDLPYGMQAKLLRALENNEVRPVGSDQTLTTDVRIVAATHQDLVEKIRLGQFRADLFYRLNIATIYLPALKERMEDFETFLYTFAKKFRVRFSHGAIQKLKRHSWPGNIRELRNVVARASAFFPQLQIEEALVEKLVDSASGAQETISVGQYSVIKEIEKQMIIQRLSANHGNQRRTATDLGMPKSTLHDRLKTYDIDPRQFVKPRSSKVSQPLS